MLTHDLIPSPLGPLLATFTPAGLCSLAFGEPPPAGPAAEHAALRRWLLAYWAGCPPPLDLALDPQVTPFQRRVHAALLEIPFGHTWSYSALAARVGSNPRAVGQANGANPLAIVVPCHRVLGVDGALVGYAGGLERKLALLRHEGAVLL